MILDSDFSLRPPQLFLSPAFRYILLPPARVVCLVRLLVFVFVVVVVVVVDYYCYRKSPFGRTG